MNDVDGKTASMVDAMWRSVYGKIRQAIRQELLRYQHRQADHSDAEFGTLADGDVQAWNAAAKRWKNVQPTGGTGTTWHQVFLGLKGTLTTTSLPAGPTNISGVGWTIKKITVTCDTSFTISVAGESMSMGAGGGTDTATGLSIAVADGSGVSVSCSAMGTGGTHLEINIYFEA